MGGPWPHRVGEPGTPNPRGVFSLGFQIVGLGSAGFRGRGWPGNVTGPCGNFGGRHSKDEIFVSGNPGQLKITQTASEQNKIRICSEIYK